MLAIFGVAFIIAGNTWEWKDGRTIALIVVFGLVNPLTTSSWLILNRVFLMLLIIQQRLHLLTTPGTRLYPPDYLLKSRTQLLLSLMTFCTITNIFLPLYYLPIYFQFVHGDDAVDTAVRLLPFVLLLISTNMASGLLLSKMGY